MSLIFLLGPAFSSNVVTWATLPTASAANNGFVYFVTDVGPDGSFWRSNGTRWVALTGRNVIGRTAVLASVTGTTTETTLATISIPAGLMGVNGQLIVKTLWSYTSSGNTKNLRVKLGGSEFLAATPTTSASAMSEVIIRNRNSASSQVSAAKTILAASGSQTVAVTTGSVDTSVAVDLTITGQLTNTGETITLESYSVELIT